MRSTLFLLCLAGLVCGSLLLGTGTALAHANIASADPGPNAVLDSAPRVVTVRFTEAVEPRFSEIAVLDSQGRQVDNKDSTVARSDPGAMTVTLGAMPNGIYTVAWKNVSSVDGHRLAGSYLFAVGQPLTGVAQQPGGQPLFQSPAEPPLRWLTLLGLLGVAGGVFFRLAVWRPAARAGRGAVAALHGGFSKAAQKLDWAFLALAVMASLGHLVSQTMTARDLSFADAIGGPTASLLAHTDWGHLWLWRIGLLAGLAAALVGEGYLERRSNPKGRQAASLLALALGCGALLTMTLASHGAATAGIRASAILVDLLHLLAAAFWVGGLFHLLAAIVVAHRSRKPEERRAVLAAVTPRFSLVAGLSVATLLFTGLYSAFAQVTTVKAADTPYGLTLIAKTGLVGVLLLLGAANLLWVRPRLRRQDAAGRWLRRLVACEAALAAVVVLSVGFLTSLEPGRQAVGGIQKPPSFQQTVEGTVIEFTMEPSRVGSDRVIVKLRDRGGKPVVDAQANITLTPLQRDLPPTILTARNIGEGVYDQPAEIGFAGLWRADVVVRRPNAFDARASFQVQVVPASAASIAPAVKPSPHASRVLLGVGLALLGGLFLAVAVLVQGEGRWRGAIATPGAAALAAGLALLAIGQNASSVASSGNPVPPTADSVERGKQLYIQDCQVCHGESGRGDGPGGAGLNPPPANFTQHVPFHSDRTLFGFIRNGVAGTAMPIWADKLSDDQTWDLVNYLRTTFGSPQGG